MQSMVCHQTSVDLNSDIQDNRTTFQFDLATWSKLARAGGTSALSGLSQMINQEVIIKALSLEEVSMRNAASLIGKADEPVVAIHFLFSGNATGRVILAFKPDTAYGLVDMALGAPAGTTRVLGDLERSALGEMGNVVSCFFLNVLADHKGAGLRLMPTPPTIVIDAAKTVTTAIMGDTLNDMDHVFVTRLTFATRERELEGRFVVLPVFPAEGEAA